MTTKLKNYMSWHNFLAYCVPDVLQNIAHNEANEIHYRISDNFGSYIEFKQTEKLGT